MIENFSFEDIDKLHLILLSKYKKEINEFDVIIGIGRGGSYTFKFLQQNFSDKKYGYLVTKRIRKYDNYSKFNVLKLFYGYFEHKKSPVSVELKSIPEINSNEKILLIDDKISSGRTLDAVINTLTEKIQIKKENISTLVLVDSKGNSNFSLIQKGKVHIFPWSGISNEYTKFLQWCKENFE